MRYPLHSPYLTGYSGSCIISSLQSHQKTWSFRPDARSFTDLSSHVGPISMRRGLSTSLCWLQIRRAAADPNYCGPTSARDDIRARRAAARPAGACAHHGGDSLCSIVRERHLAAWREAAASTARTPWRSGGPAWRSARPERGLRRQVARALPRRRGGSLGSSRAGKR